MTAVECYVGATNICFREVITNMTKNGSVDSEFEGRDELEIDIDRMVNEGLGGGLVTDQNGLIEETTTDTMDKAVEVDLMDRA